MSENIIYFYLIIIFAICQAAMALTIMITNGLYDKNVRKTRKYKITQGCGAAILGLSIIFCMLSLYKIMYENKI
jgi:hypothetical protein